MEEREDRREGEWEGGRMGRREDGRELGWEGGRHFFIRNLFDRLQFFYKKLYGKMGSRDFFL